MRAKIYNKILKSDKTLITDNQNEFKNNNRNSNNFCLASVYIHVFVTNLILGHEEEKKDSNFVV